MDSFHTCVDGIPSQETHRKEVNHKNTERIEGPRQFVSEDRQYSLFTEDESEFDCELIPPERYATRQVQSNVENIDKAMSKMSLNHIASPESVFGQSPFGEELTKKVKEKKTWKKNNGVGVKKSRQQKEPISFDKWASINNVKDKTGSPTLMCSMEPYKKIHSPKVVSPEFKSPKLKGSDQKPKSLKANTIRSSPVIPMVISPNVKSPKETCKTETELPNVNLKVTDDSPQIVSKCDASQLLQEIVDMSDSTLKNSDSDEDTTGFYRLTSSRRSSGIHSCRASLCGTVDGKTGSRNSSIASVAESVASYYCVEEIEEIIHTDDSGCSIIETRYGTEPATTNCSVCSGRSVDSSRVRVPPEVIALSNHELFNKLSEFGEMPGPINQGTRKIYEQRLAAILADPDFVNREKEQAG